jgi:hypothetical protein
MSYSYNGGTDIGFSENHPFLSMLAAVDGEQEQQNVPLAPAVEQQQHPVSEAGRVKLPDFWPHAPGQCFISAFSYADPDPAF